MQFSENWLREWINPDISSEALADVLTMGGLEVEEMAPAAPAFTGVVVGEITARRFRLNVGDKLTLIIPERSSAAGGVTPRLQRLNVVGVFKVGAELDGSLAMIHLADAAQMLRWQPHQVQSVRLALKDLYQAPQVSSAIAQQLGAGYRAVDWTLTQGDRP